MYHEIGMLLLLNKNAIWRCWPSSIGGWLGAHGLDKVPGNDQEANLGAPKQFFGIWARWAFVNEWKRCYLYIWYQVLLINLWLTSLLRTVSWRLVQFSHNAAWLISDNKFCSSLVWYKHCRTFISKVIPVHTQTSNAAPTYCMLSSRNCWAARKVISQVVSLKQTWEEAYNIPQRDAARDSHLTAVV